MSDKVKLYDVFDIDRKDFITRFPLQKTTKKNVKAVCSVQASNTSLTDESRAIYLRDSGAFHGDENAVVPDSFDSYTVTAALAQALFKGCPKIIEVKDESVVIVDEELFDALDEGVVNQAFMDFQMLRGKTLSARLNYLG